MILNLSLIVLIISSLVAYSALEFAVPLFIGNGQTVGKKIFGVAVMRIDGVKVSPFVMFARAILGKYTLETMIPVFAVLMFFSNSGIWLVAGLVSFMIAALELGLLIFSKTRPMIHDALATTVCVDMASQMIFNSQEELIEYKKRIHKEDAEKAKYLN